jgi:type II secretory pathway pseudopilin PulG
MGGEKQGYPEILRGLKAAQDATPQRSVRRPEAGTTLIELIVVLALVGLLFGVTVPALTAIPADGSGRQAADSLRVLAVRSGQLVVGDSLVALPDGRTFPRRSLHAE